MTLIYVLPFFEYIVYINTRRNLKNAKGKKLTIENWILTTTWTARTFIIQLLNRPFCNQFESFSLSLSFFPPLPDLKKESVFLFQWNAINNREREREKSTYYCVKVFLELDLQKNVDFWERLFPSSSYVCIHFLKMKMHSDLTGQNVLKIMKHLIKIALHKKIIMLTYNGSLKRNYIVFTARSCLYEIPMLSHT